MNYENGKAVAIRGRVIGGWDEPQETCLGFLKGGNNPVLKYLRIETDDHQIIDTLDSNVQEIGGRES